MTEFTPPTAYSSGVNGFPSMKEIGKNEKLILVFEPTYKNLRVLCLKVSVTFNKVAGGLLALTDELKYLT